MSLELIARMRARATSEQITADRTVNDYYLAAMHEHAATVLREEADAAEARLAIAPKISEPWCPACKMPHEPFVSST